MSSKVTISGFFSFILVAFSISLHAQVTFEVTSPSAIAEKIQCGFADFGPLISLGPTSGEVVYVAGSDSLGCLPISQDLTDKIAMIDRGDCQFSDKAFNAQAAGAIALIIALEPGRELQFVLPGGTLADQITIPVICMSESDHLIIKQALKSTIVSGNIYTDDVFADETVIYEEQFDGGLNGWVSTNPVGPDSPWVWTADGSADGSVFFVNSPTSQSNGAAIYDANLYNRAFAGMPGPYPFYTGELTSPAIDVSDHEDLYLVFYQANWPLNARVNGGPQMYVQFSVDDGSSYSDAIPVTTENIFSLTATNIVHSEAVRVLLPGVNFSENLRLRFTFDGDFYVWAIDDVRLVAPPAEELSVEQSFYPPIHFATPTSQITTDTFGLLAEVFNGGSDDLFGNEVSVSILDESGTEVYGQIIPTDIPALSSATVTFDSWAPVLIPGNYTLRYGIENAAISDAFPDNNTQSYPFVITRDTFAQELTPQDEILTSYTNSREYFFGSFFTMSSLETGCIFDGTQIAVAANDGVLDDEVFTLYLLKWVDDNDGYPQFVEELNRENVNPSNHPNFEIVAFAPFEASPGMVQHGLVNLDVADGKWFLNSQQPLDVVDLDPATYAIVGEFANEDISFSMTTGEPIAGITNLLYNTSELSPNSYFTGFANNSYPIIRTIISCQSAVINTSNPDLDISIFPSVTNDEILIKLNLENRSDVAIQVRDMQGRLVQQRELKNSINEKVSHSMRDLAAGVYLVTVATEAGYVQQRITRIE